MVSAIYLFVTADIPHQVINDAIAAAGSLDEPGLKFSLVQSPMQTSFDIKTTTPISAPFATGFDGWSVAELGNHVERLSCERRREDDSTAGTLLFAILDPQSARDHTINLVHKHSELMEDAVETLDWNGTSMTLAWVGARIRFCDVYQISAAITKDDIFFDRDAQHTYVGTDGIWRFDDEGHRRWAACLAYDADKPWYYQPQEFQGPVSEDGLFHWSEGVGRQITFAELDETIQNDVSM